MPCNSGNSHEYLARDLRDANKEITKLEAIICAITQELRRRDIVKEVLCDAEASSGMTGEIWGFFVEHAQRDRQRLLKDVSSFLEGYSNDEVAMIKELFLNK